MRTLCAALRASRLVLLAVVSPVILLADTIVVDDTFADGNRAGQNPPSSLNWLVNSGSTVSTSAGVGTFQLTNAASRLVVGYLAAAPLNVSSGQSLSLEITFRTDATPANIANGFNLALFNSGGSRILADFSGTSNAAFANYNGYGAKSSGLGSTVGSNVTLRQRNAGTSASPMSTSGDWVTLATAVGTTGLGAPNIDYIATLTITNNGATVSLNYTLKTADGVSTLHTLSGVDSSSLVTAFDTVMLYFQTAEFAAGSLNISHIKVSLLGDSPVVAPVVTSQPQSQTVNAGENVTFAVSADGTPPLSYQWAVGGVAIDGATSSSFSLSNVQPEAAGNYAVVVTNAAGSVRSQDALLTVNTVLTAPQLTTQPASQTVNLGDDATFTVAATGSTPLSYAWMKDGSPLAGATSPLFVVSHAQLSDAGSYSVVVSNGAGSAVSNPAILMVNLLAPAIAQQPVSETAGIGSSTTLSIRASGSPPLAYQWSKNGVVIPGATNASLSFGNLQLADAGSYLVTVSNAAGTVASTPATITVTEGPSGTLSQFNLTGFATVGAGTTGGGVVPETDPSYIKVTNALELANALVAAAKTAGSVKVIEIMNDLDLGWNEIGSTVQTLASSPFRSHAAPKLHPVLLVTGMSLLDIKPKSGLTLFSANGATIRHCNFNIKGTSNIIIRNLKFDENWEWDEATKGNYDSNDWDFITLSNGAAATNVWVDHCTFTKAYDGILDQKAGTQYVTLSWCAYVGDDGATNPNSWVRLQIAALEANRSAYPFYNFLRTNGFSVEDIVQIIQGHDKTHLMGSNSLDAGNNSLSATFHHLWFNSMWDRCVPRLRGGNVHDYNILVDDTQVLAARRLRDTRAAALTPALRNTLDSTYSFNPPINGSISTENGAVLVERSVYLDCIWPLRNNQTDPTNPIYTGRIQALDTIYLFHNPDGTLTNVRGNSTDSGNPLGPFQAPIVSFAWNLPGNTLPYSYVTDDPAQLAEILAAGAGAGRLTWAKQNWLRTTYDDQSGPPVINTPPADASVTVGDTVSFTVVASGIAPISYQWSKDGTPLPGATLSTLSLSNVTVSAAGDYDVTVSSSGGTVTSTPARLRVSKASASVTLTNLVATYDGLPKVASATTIPGGLAVSFTYDGSASPPVQAGSYSVVATVNDANYDGSASDTLTIAKALATVSLSSLAQVYDGTAKSAVASTSPSGIAVTLTYDGDTTPPINAGNYAVVGTVTDSNYEGSVSGTLSIAKATASVTLGDLAQTYDGSPKGVTATTDPVGLKVSLAYNGNSFVPSDAGSYFVDARVDDLNFSGTGSGTLVVAKAFAEITLTPLKKAYDGAPSPVVATTIPAGLTVTFTYDGGTSPPVYPGPHTVIGTIEDANYKGTVSNTLVITTTALVRHAPMVNGMINGSIQVILPESFSLNGTATLANDLLVGGHPTIIQNGQAAPVSVIEGPGAIIPSNYIITLNRGAVVRTIIRRIDGIQLPVVVAPPIPGGTRDAALSSSNKNPGNFTTLRNLTLNSGSGMIAVPAGTYGTFTANSNTGFIIGEAGATEPAVYNLQNLIINSSGSVQVVGPVILTLANTANINGTVGDSAHPEWLVLNVAAGGVTLNNTALLRAIVAAPNGAVVINGNATLLGEVAADQLKMSNSSLLDEPTP